MKNYTRSWQKVLRKKSFSLDFFTPTDISTISHEIRNPLTLIYSTLQMIEASNPEVLNIRHWSDLHSDIEYMKQLLEELSAYNNGQRLSPSSTDFDIFLKKISLLHH